MCRRKAACGFFYHYDMTTHMRRYRTKRLMSVTALLVIVLLAPSGYAREGERSGWEVGGEISSITYKEPRVMKQQGVMKGVGVSFTTEQEMLLRVEVRYGQGTVDYVSSQTGALADIKDYLWETRLLLGQDMYRDETTVITPYVGFGYRYLNDNSQGRLTTTGYLGYERESNYYYSPVGIWFARRLSDVWHCRLMAEYDFFWRGVQKSRLGGIPGYNDLINDQHAGYGARASARIVKENAGHILFLESFVRFWDIGRSEASNVTFAGVLIGYGYEPENTSREIGLRLGAFF